MPLDLLGRDPIRTALDLTLIDDATRAVRACAQRLAVLGLRARTTASAAHWSAPSARAFGERAEALGREVATAETLADEAAAALVRARADVGARPGA